MFKYLLTISQNIKEPSSKPEISQEKFSKQANIAIEKIESKKIKSPPIESELMKKLTYIDLFAGCGGISLGLYQAGWNGLFAIEKSPMAFETLQFNLITKKKHFDWPMWLPQTNHDLRTVLHNYNSELKNLAGKVDLIVGGPPCQGFSTAGRRNRNDQRNKLVDSYVEFVALIKPRAIFFENVYGFTTTKKNIRDGTTYAKYVTEQLRQLGYDIQGRIIDFSRFGVPQRRKRFILVGVRNGSAEVFFDALENNRTSFLRSKKIRAFPSVKVAISDLEKKNGTVADKDMPRFLAGLYATPKNTYQKLMRQDVDGRQPDSHRFSNHNETTTLKFAAILKSAPKNKNASAWVNLHFGSQKHSIIPLADSKPSPTLTTLPDDYIHYAEPRILTVREYARIQSFGDWFEFKGKYTTGGKARIKEVPRYTQIGNAIPPIFGEQVGFSFREVLINGLL